VSDAARGAEEERRPYQSYRKVLLVLASGIDAVAYWTVAVILGDCIPVFFTYLAARGKPAIRQGRLRGVVGSGINVNSLAFVVGIHLTRDQSAVGKE